MLALILALALVAAILTSVVLLAQASASDSGSTHGADCPQGAISAIGPVDADGRGDTTPDVSCISP